MVLPKEHKILFLITMIRYAFIMKISHYIKEPGQFRKSAVNMHLAVKPCENRRQLGESFFYNAFSMVWIKELLQQFAVTKV